MTLALLINALMCFILLAASTAEEEAAKTPGFVGSRGKRNLSEAGKQQDNIDLEIELARLAEDESMPVFRKTREPTGFFGVRGKKDYEFLGDHDRFYDNELSDYYPKRSPSGFVGMRGKKFILDLMDAQKRSPSTGFVGMRGKKSPTGFMGMRGKKSELESNLDDQFIQHLQDMQRIYQQSDPIEYYEKRMPSGFVGMRG